MTSDLSQIAETVCPQYLNQQYQVQLTEYNFLEAQYYIAINYYINLINFTKKQSQKQMTIPQYCSDIVLILSNYIADEEQYEDLRFLFQTNLNPVILENVQSQIYPQDITSAIILLNSAKPVCVNPKKPGGQYILLQIQVGQIRKRLQC
ncbi:Hypothetical_protein [Hexamita inflata]|uniref:Hypothetical_protein n=1 Tax=Hexamita inflata TaxID=28002 RepID=A0AA86QXV4_9EUKA|nr:Hypothetical protein HINF_LOCUS55654 [Hexamita inflata]